MKKVEKKYLIALGERITDFRKSKGITQVELADKLGTFHTQIGRIERGEVNPSIITLLKIANELKVSVGELVSI